VITQFEGKPRDEAKRNRKGGRSDNAGGQRDYSNASKKHGGKQFGKNKFGDKKFGDKKFGDKPAGGGKPYQKRKPDGEGGSDGGANLAAVSRRNPTSRAIAIAGRKAILPAATRSHTEESGRLKARGPVVPRRTEPIDAGLDHHPC